jgi:anhydro-N-acetylmuramic acid kinase
MIVAGVMSGTSADGVDVAICRIRPSRSAGGSPKITLIGHAGFAYEKAVRATVMRVMNAEETSVAEMSRLHWRLGAVYAEAVAEAAATFKVKLDLVACHGQTVYHQAAPTVFGASSVRATWQMGEASVIAERLHVPVASDFRAADMAAGGQGAPLVPMLDYSMFRDAKKSRVLLNLGGIANVTAIPAGSSIEQVMAFDTGPANMVIDRSMEVLFKEPFDRDGETARRGCVIQSIVDELIRDDFFAALPPKSCGREQFGEAFASRFIASCRLAGAADADIMATATALTAQSLLDAYRRFVLPHLCRSAPLAKTELIAAGGGVSNATLLQMLRAGFEPLGVKLRLMDELGMPSQAKEAVAFALLGWLTWHRLPGNVPSATGASRPVILGKLTCP